MFRLNIINDNIGSAFMSTSKLNDSILWHARLGHVHFKRMQDMSKDGLIPTSDMDIEKCKTCMLTKITKKPFQNVKRETYVLELIHSDLCDVHATPSIGNKKYFVTFIDDASPSPPSSCFDVVISTTPPLSSPPIYLHHGRHHLHHSTIIISTLHHSTIYSKTLTTLIVSTSAPRHRNSLNHLHGTPDYLWYPRRTLKSNQRYYLKCTDIAKNLKKTVKTGQSRTRERKREYKSRENAIKGISVVTVHSSSPFYFELNQRGNSNWLRGLRIQVKRYTLAELYVTKLCDWPIPKENDTRF
ncbi:zinc finger, CCHC-type containing protein [Tanacetum coccineum]